MKRHATDHRGLVLESIATSPNPELQSIHSDCTSSTFPKKSVDAMVWVLCREGLVNRVNQPNGNVTHHLTKTGFDYLASGHFDRKLPEPHTRPNRRARRKEHVS